MRRLFTLLAVIGIASCQQQATPQFYKKPDLTNKSLAVPLSSSTVSVVVPWGQSQTSSPFLEALKHEFRMRGWRLIVQGVTGRAGDTQSINSGATYTLLSQEQMRGHMSFGQLQPGLINLVMVENKTGEEVMVLRGYMWNANKLATQVVQAIEQTGR